MPDITIVYIVNGDDGIEMVYGKESLAVEHASTGSYTVEAWRVGTGPLWLIDQDGAKREHPKEIRIVG